LLIPSSVHAQNTPPPPPVEVPLPVYDRPVAAPVITASDLAAVRDAIGFASRGRPKDATDAQQRITGPTARKLVEWAILHSGNNGADFARFQAFIAANPNWPNIAMFRRRAEAMLWEEHADLATIRTLTGDKPVSAKGRFALGRALLAQGDRASAQALIREAWRTEPMPFDVEEEILETFGDLITRADDKARMEHWLYANDPNIALRAAIRAGGDEPAIAKARAAVNEKASNAKDLIQGLPSGAHQDTGVLFSRIQLLGRAGKIAEAADLMLSAPHEVARIYDPDAWWIERRLLAHKLLDTNAALKAYRIVRDAAPPTKENLRVEHEFTAGWIALRFLKDPATAAQHFAGINGIGNPIALARAGYWRGRAAEAMNKPQEARAHYEQAARYGTAYYGQLARAKLGLSELALTSSPVSEADKRTALANSEIVRAVEILYATDQRDEEVRSSRSDRRGPRRARFGPRDAGGPRRADDEARGCTLHLIDREGSPWARPCVRLLRVPNLRAAALHGDRAGRRACGRLFDRAPGECLQCKGSVERARARPHAGDTRGRSLHRQEVQRRL
jgi:soluble lytic murein transglycosylase